MKKIYLDSNFKCHTIADDSLLCVQTDLFDDKCDDVIEGYRYIPNGESWTRYDGVIFYGEMIAPWKPYSELSSMQRKYERAELAQLKNIQNDLNASYQEGINSI